MLKSTTLKSSKSKSKLPCQNTFASSYDGQISSLSSRKKTGPLKSPTYYAHLHDVELYALLYPTVAWADFTLCSNWADSTTTPQDVSNHWESLY